MKRMHGNLQLKYVTHDDLVAEGTNQTLYIPTGSYCAYMLDLTLSEENKTLAIIIKDKNAVLDPGIDVSSSAIINAIEVTYNNEYGTYPNIFYEPYSDQWDFNKVVIVVMGNFVKIVPYYSI